MFAQVRISAVNTTLTGLYLFVALPLAGVHLPLAKTVLVIAFLVGLLPVVGNLVSNTIIVILSLSVSLPVAIASLIFLVVIHKLEYFLNAHMIGTQVHAHAWELLLRCSSWKPLSASPVSSRHRFTTLTLRMSL